MDPIVVANYNILLIALYYVKTLLTCPHRVLHIELSHSAMVVRGNAYVHEFRLFGDGATNVIDVCTELELDCVQPQYRRAATITLYRIMAASRTCEFSRRIFSLEMSRVTFYRLQYNLEALFNLFFNTYTVPLTVYRFLFAIYEHMPCNIITFDKLNNLFQSNSMFYSYYIDVPNYSVDRALLDNVFNTLINVSPLNINDLPCNGVNFLNLCKRLIKKHLSDDISDADIDVEGDECRGIPIALIHGPPGSGKTAFAMAFIKTFARAFGDKVIWINAQNNESIRMSFQFYATYLYCLNGDTYADLVDYFAKLNAGRVLFVFDNFNDALTTDADRDSYRAMCPNQKFFLYKRHYANDLAMGTDIPMEDPKAYYSLLHAFMGHLQARAFECSLMFLSRLEHCLIGFPQNKNYVFKFSLIQ